MSIMSSLIAHPVILPSTQSAVADRTNISQGRSSHRAKLADQAQEDRLQTTHCFSVGHTRLERYTRYHQAQRSLYKHS